MRKNVLGKMLSVVLAAALAVSPAVEVMAASADEASEISSFEEIEETEEFEADAEDIEAEETADAEEEIEIISVEADEQEAASEASSEESAEEKTEEVKEAEDAEESSDSAEFTAVSEIPSGATKVGEEKELGTNVMGQLYQWGSGKEKHVGLYIYSPNNSGVEITKKVFEVFKDKYESITDVIFGVELNTIGYKAFTKCTALKNITFPDSLLTLGESAFSGCTSLKSVVIPSKVKKADNDIFSDCTSLTEVTFEEGMTVIPAAMLQSYYGKGYVTTVNIPATVVTIGERAFKGQDSLKNVNFEGDKLSRIEEQAFASTAIEKIELADGITYIGYKAFENCAQLKTLELPEDLETIGESAFSGCSSLKNVVIPKKVKSANNDIFSGCTSLTEVTFEEGMTVIPTAMLQSYYGKGYVTTVNIPSTVVTIGERAFKGQDSLKTVNFAGDKLSRIEEQAFVSTAIEDIELADGVTYIGYKAFENCAQLKTLELPEDLETIGESAFVGCSRLKRVVIPKKVKSANNDIFSGCTSLTEVTFEEGMTVIPTAMLQSYYGKGYVTTVNIPSTVVTIGERAFKGQESLKNVNFAGDRLSRIEEQAFVGTAIEEMKLADGVTFIGYKAFENCSKLKSIELSKDLDTIGESAFSGCSSLTSIIIPSKVKKAHNDIFSGCTSLTTMTFADGMETIPEQMVQSYYGTNYVTTVFIPASVTAVGKSAFKKCDSLKTVYYRGTEATKEAMSIADNNDALVNANWVFVSKSVTGLTVDTEDKKFYVDELTSDASKVFTVNATISPSDADITTIWAEKDNISGKAVSSVKQVSKDGNVTSFEVTLTGKAGESVISFRTEDGDFAAVCRVAVIDREQELWGDVPAELKTLFNGSHENIPEDVWYAFNESSKPAYFLTSGKTDIKKVYTGNSIELSNIYVFDGKKMLVDGVDYTVSYNNNVNAAKADDANAPEVVITGIGANAVNAVFTFTITPASSGLTGKMKSVKLAGFKTTVSYTGSALTMADLFNANDKICKAAGWDGVTLYVVNSKTKAKTVLTENVDYTVSIEDRSNVGKVKVTFTGIGGFTGTVSKTVTIKALNAAKDFDITVEDATYSKAGVKPTVTVTYAGRTLVLGTDYTVTYKNNTKAALSTDKNAPFVTVKAKGNYAGTSGKVKFSIEKAPVSGLQMKVKDVAFKAKGGKGYFISKPSFTDNGKAVTVGKNKDIKVVYTYTYDVETTLKDGTVRKIGDTVDPKDKLISGTTIKVTAKVEPGSAKNSYTGTYEISQTYRVVKK